MKKAVMISIQPKWCELIASGKKTIEVRKTRPQLETPFKCYIYCTSRKIKAVTDPNTAHVKINVSKRAPIKRVSYIYPWYQKVIGEFVCDEIYDIENHGTRFMVDDDIALTNRIAKQSCLDFEDLSRYLGNKNGYGWHISDLKIYDTPKELSEFQKPCPFPSEDCTDYPYMDWDCDAEIDEEEPFCKRQITRPPQSWCYVAEVTE